MKQKWALVPALLCCCFELVLSFSRQMDPRAGAANMPFNRRGLQQDDASPPCECEATSTNKAIVVQILMFDSQGIIDMVEWNARDFELYKNGTVKIEIRKTPTMPELFEEIESDARTGGGLFDAYYTNPVIIGTAAMLGGFLDIGPYVKASPYADWTDVLPVFRTHVTNFEEHIYLILLDGDTHAMFYRRDVLEHFGLPVPRTWTEYIDVARAVHGKTFEGIELSGSCVSRVAGDHAQYWAHLVLATITQTLGTERGSLFDTEDMTALTGEAMAEMLRIHEEMAMYGTPDEFDKTINAVHNAHINDGSCVLTYSWGDLYKRSRAQGSKVGDKIGIAPTPGSTRVLDRSTGTLVDCDKDRCPYGTYYEDIGWVNYAPYAANGGWGGAISAHTTPEKQEALVEFFLWASGKEQSRKYVIPNATLPIEQINGQDPWRKSHLDVDKWVEQGYTAELAREYVKTILHNTQSKNVAVDIKFPKSGEIMSVLDREVNRYLVRAVKENSIPEGDKPAERLKTASEVTRKWTTIINAYDARGDTVAPILEIYQRFNGVYFPDVDLNQISTVRPVGYSLFAIISLFCFGSAIWVIIKRNNRVVKASQPPFLLLLCFGVFVLGSSILPMGIDDSIASVEGCSAACIATPWLAAIGFTVTFSTLYSKIRRFNLVYENAARFRRVVVTVQDVIRPMIVMLTMNVILLLLWTLLDPPQWERVLVGQDASGTIVSFGWCTSEGSTVSLIMMILLAALNFAALVLAGVQAYKARHFSSQFSESKYIGLSMICMIQAFLIGLPALLLARSNPTANFIVASLLVFVCCMSIQCLIFVPKYRLSRKPDVSSQRNLSVLRSAQRTASNMPQYSSEASRRFSLSRRDSSSSNCVEVNNGSGINTTSIQKSTLLNVREPHEAPLAESDLEVPQKIGAHRRSFSEPIGEEAKGDSFVASTSNAQLNDGSGINSTCSTQKPNPGVSHESTLGKSDLVEAPHRNGDDQNAFETTGDEANGESTDETNKLAALASESPLPNGSSSTEKPELGDLMAPDPTVAV